MNLTEARDEIARVDDQMAELFVRRMEAVRDIATYKREHGMPIEDKAQEARIIERCGTLVHDEQMRSFYVQFLQNTMDVSKRWQHRLMEGMRVAYCGVEGAFAHIATTRIFPDAFAVPYASFEEAYAAVESGTCDTVVLPMENSRTGEVGQVLDLMYSGSLHVNGVYDLAIVQNLLGVPGATIDDIRTVISHPQAIAQCRDYLLAHGIDKDQIYRNVFWTASEARLRLQGYLLYVNMKMLHDRHTAIITLTNDERRRFKVKNGDTEGIVNMPLQILGLRLSIFINEDTEHPGTMKLSLRSVGDFPCDQMASRFFGGGGHKNASGGKLQCSMPEAIEKVKAAIDSYADMLK